MEELSLPSPFFPELRVTLSGERGSSLAFCINLGGSWDSGSVILTMVAIEDGVAVGKGPALCSSPSCSLLPL